MTIFGDNLRAARKAAGLTQDELAQKLGMLRTNYVPYETGKKYPDDDYLPLIAKEIGVSVEKLLAWKILEEYQGDALVEAVKELPEDLKQTVLFEYFAQKDPADIIAIFKRTHTPEKLKELVEAAQAELKRVK